MAGQYGVFGTFERIFDSYLVCNLPGNWYNYLCKHFLAVPHCCSPPSAALSWTLRAECVLPLPRQGGYLSQMTTMATILLLFLLKGPCPLYSCPSSLMKQRGDGSSFIQLIGFTCSMMGWGGGRICSICCTTASKSTPSPSADHHPEDSVAATAPAVVNVIGERCTQVGEEWYT